jgi:hypothetical protein
MVSHGDESVCTPGLCVSGMENGEGWVQRGSFELEAWWRVDMCFVSSPIL